MKKLINLCMALSLMVVLTACSTQDAAEQVESIAAEASAEAAEDAADGESSQTAAGHASAAAHLQTGPAQNPTLPTTTDLRCLSARSCSRPPPNRGSCVSPLCGMSAVPGPPPQSVHSATSGVNCT